ncbi:MAG: hypothetical protein A3K13_10305 [Gemmatimonadetes bacterium RIFCSPLOWO2_12_FULL_68_9]|nr:MAG: hypothetical protein A3K13_10305 [Gemmatimonadetes bacterium RIFCSPLOWO2_12_FULL_68_9]
MGARLSTTMARLGEPFELSIVARIPPGHILYFPDTLDPRNGIESVGAARWVAEPIAGDSVEMTIVYALRSFAGGSLALPEPQLVLHRPAGGAVPAPGPGGDGGRVGRWADASALEPGQFTRRMILPGNVRVAPVLPGGQPQEGFHPRPAADVLGHDWSQPVLGLLGFATLLVLGTTGLAVRRTADRIRPWLSARRAAPLPPAQSPRSRALAELEAILALGLHRSGRTDEFYTRTVHAARRYVESVHVGCGPAFTDREIIGHLVAAAGAGSVATFGSVVRRAEVVRFGVRRPGAGEAEADLALLRDWIGQYPSANGQS